MLHVDFNGPVFHATLVRRYKRFFADVVLQSGEEVTAHTPNTGRMTGLLREGNPVLLTKSDNKKRKLAYTVEAIHVGSSWVGANPVFANTVVKNALQARVIRALGGYKSVRSEVKTEAGPGGRIDFLLSAHARGRPDCFVEVKSATLREGGLATFPDAPSERGRKHIQVLRALVERGHRAALCYLVQRTDCKAFAPARSVDPDYAKALLAAKADGVEVYAIQAALSEHGVDVTAPFPVRLNAGSTKSEGAA